MYWSLFQDISTFEIVDPVISLSHHARFFRSMTAGGQDTCARTLATPIVLQKRELSGRLEHALIMTR